jgi:hypothetical protein
MESEYIPSWLQLNEQNLPVKTVSVYASLAYAITLDGQWKMSWLGSLTLTIAQWEQHGKITKVPRCKSLSKIRILKKNVSKVPVILQMVANGHVPKSLVEVVL